MLFRSVLAEEREDVRALDVTGWHAEGLRFKFRPDRSPRQDWTAGDLEGVCRACVRVFLAVEASRHGRPFPDPAAYRAWDGDREPADGGMARRMSNLARSLRRGGCTTRSPRDALYRELPGLLDPDAFGNPGWTGTSAAWLARWKRLP